MNRDHAEQWKVIIHEDLTDARRRLTMSADISDRFLCDRIAENEAILERLAAIERATPVSEVSQAPALTVT